jgi:hypothetical protein
MIAAALAVVLAAASALPCVASARNPRAGAARAFGRALGGWHLMTALGAALMVHGAVRCYGLPARSTGLHGGIGGVTTTVAPVIEFLGGGQIAAQGLQAHLQGRTMTRSPRSTPRDP